MTACATVLESTSNLLNKVARPPGVDLGVARNQIRLFTQSPLYWGPPTQSNHTLYRRGIKKRSTNYGDLIAAARTEQFQIVIQVLTQPSPKEATTVEVDGEVREPRLIQ